MAQRPADVVQPLKQGMLFEIIDLKMQDLPARSSDRLRRQVNVQGVAFAGLDLGKELLDNSIIEGHRQDAVIEAVVIEYVGKAGGDEAAEAIFQDRPRRVFARGAAAEVITCQQDAHTLVARLVEHEIRIRSAIFEVAPVGEERVRKTGEPYSRIAHGACSREEPQPKLSPASRMLTPW